MKSIKTTIRGLAGLMLLTLAFVAPTSCSDTVDCYQVCNSYSDCVENIDVTECTDLCEDNADRSQAEEDALDFCEECIEGRSCLEQIEAGCFDNCPIEVIPE